MQKKSQEYGHVEIQYACLPLEGTSVLDKTASYKHDIYRKRFISLLKMLLFQSVKMFFALKVTKTRVSSLE